jgi:hypothetical protein
MRWRSCFRAPELDQELAAGADPLASDQLLWRAQQLVEPKCKLTLAATIEAVVEAVDVGGPWTAPGPRIRSRGVLRTNRRLLMAVAERLRSGDPVDLRGLARAELLVSYDSAMYGQPSAQSLRAQLIDLLIALQPDGAWQPAEQ